MAEFGLSSLNRKKFQNKAGSPPKEGFAIRNCWRDSMQNDMAVTERSQMISITINN